jgi:RNA polymerase sigma-70 factor, ECF subfamily
LRNAATCRKIFSRTRTRILEERSSFAIDQERHRALLHSFAEAARGGDIVKLVALLDDNVVLHGDGGGKALANERPVVGRVAVTQFIITVPKRFPQRPLPSRPCLMASLASFGG